LLGLFAFGPRRPQNRLTGFCCHAARVIRLVEPSPLRFFRNLGRSREIATVLFNQGFGEVLERLHLRKYLQWGRRLFFRKVEEPVLELTTATRIRLALQELGPTFIKFGQLLSTRPDLVPRDIIDELANLQEDVPSFDPQAAIQLIERELRAPLSRLFRTFEREPIAAASLGQVHRALHPDGTVLAVKVRRPNAVRDVERDLALMADLAVLAERHLPEVAMFDPVGLVRHFARTIRRELNFRREGRTIDEFRRLFAGDATLKIPRVYDRLTSEAVLTMEFIHGCRADDAAAIAALGISPRQLAIQGANIFLKQAFEFGVFHGDPHPGNLRVLPDGTIALLDFGMIGILDESKREQLIDVLLAVERQDVSRTVEMIRQIGRPSRDIDEVLLRADVRDFLDNYYGIPLEQLNVGAMLSDFVAILANHGLRCPADFMLLIRCFITLEGLGRTLDPAFNLATEVAPFVERLVRDRYNPRRLLDRVVSDTRTLVRTAYDLPLQVGTTLQKLNQDQLKVQLEHRGLDHLITEFDRSSNRVVVGLVTAALIVASALVIRTGASTVWVTVPTFVLSGLLGIWLVYGILRSGRL
jgi:ubiquinone biosynthesis protein